MKLEIYGPDARDQGAIASCLNIPNVYTTLTSDFGVFGVLGVVGVEGEWAIGVEFVKLAALVPAPEIYVRNIG